MSEDFHICFQRLQTHVGLQIECRRCELGNVHLTAGRRKVEQRLVDRQMACYGGGESLNECVGAT